MISLDKFIMKTAYVKKEKKKKKTVEVDVSVWQYTCHSVKKVKGLHRYMKKYCLTIYTDENDQMYNLYTII